jgi:hypothetical protein
LTIRPKKRSLVLPAAGGCSAALHDDDATGVVGQPGGVGGVGSGSQGSGEGCNYGVAGTGHVHHLIGAVDGNLQRRFLFFKGYHAVAAAGDDQGLELHLADQRRAGFE